MKILSVLMGIVLIVACTANASHLTTVGLGTADGFAVLAGSGITNTGTTTINGDVGSFPTTTQTGFASVVLTGTNHAGDAVTQGAKTDLTTAYNDAAGRTPVTTVPTELGGTTLTHGVYSSTAGTFGITGALTLDAQGDPSAVFIFQMASTLTTATASSVVLIGGAQSCNVFWQVGSSATLGTRTTFRGNILALTSVTLVTEATVDGRVLARNGAVTMDTNTITRSTCAATPTAPPAPTIDYAPHWAEWLRGYCRDFPDSITCKDFVPTATPTPTPTPTVAPTPTATPTPTAAPRLPDTSTR